MSEEIKSVTTVFKTTKRSFLVGDILNDWKNADSGTELPHKTDESLIILGFSYYGDGERDDTHIVYEIDKDFYYKFIKPLM